MSIHNYQSDITREEFELVKSELESVRNRTKPRKVDLYDILCAILHVLKGGIQGRMLPSNFPKWQTVYFYFQMWSKKKKEKIVYLNLF